MYDECSICLEKYIQGDEVATIKTCRHRFHHYCINQWIATWVLLCNRVRLYIKSLKKNIQNWNFSLYFFSGVERGCPLCRASFWYQKKCIECQQDFNSNYSVQVKCDYCCALRNFIDALIHYIQTNWFQDTIQRNKYDFITCHVELFLGFIFHH